MSEELNFINRQQDYSSDSIELIKSMLMLNIEEMGNQLINSSNSLRQDLLENKITIEDFFEDLVWIHTRIIMILHAETNLLLPVKNLEYYEKYSIQWLLDNYNSNGVDIPIKVWKRFFSLLKLLSNVPTAEILQNCSGVPFNFAKLKILSDFSYKITFPNALFLESLKLLTKFNISGKIFEINYLDLRIFAPLLKIFENRTPLFSERFIITPEQVSGTFFTPNDVIDTMINISLKPLLLSCIEKEESKEKKIQKILNLKICDPACNYGEILVKIIDFLGIFHAKLACNQQEISSINLSLSKRKILENCIYGVDLSPLSVELTKVHLWLNTACINHPYINLENIVKSGNSLIGEINKDNIETFPVDDFNAIKGRKNIGLMGENTELVRIAKKNVVQDKVSMLDFINPQQIRVSDKRTNAKFRLLQLQSNQYTSISFWNMYEDQKFPPKRLIHSKQNIDSGEEKEILRLSQEYQFFNWFLEFPEVFCKKNPGFDYVILNPPWNIVEIDEIDYFSKTFPQILKASDSNKRRRSILKLQDTNPDEFHKFIQYCYRIQKKLNYFSNHASYQPKSRGTMKYDSLFLKRAFNLINRDGKICALVPNAQSSNKQLFNQLMDKNAFDYIINFTNNDSIFPIHRLFEISLIGVSGANTSKKGIIISTDNVLLSDLKKYSATFYQNSDSQIKNEEKVQSGPFIKITESDIFNFCKGNYQIPFFNSGKDYQLLKQLFLRYNSIIILQNEEKRDNTWGIRFRRSINISSSLKDRILLSHLHDMGAIPLNPNCRGGKWKLSSQQLNGPSIFLPVYTGSMIWHYDHRRKENINFDFQATHRMVDVSNELHSDYEYLPIPQYWVLATQKIKKNKSDWNQDWILCFRRISSRKNARTIISAIIPNFETQGSLTSVLPSSFLERFICYYVNISSIFFDYIARMFSQGLDISSQMFKNMPIFPPLTYSDIILEEIKKRAIPLIYTSIHLKSFAVMNGLSELQRPFEWIPQHREKLQAELDAIFALMYGFTREDIEYILETFEVLKNLEITDHEEYRTKRLILESFDEFTKNSQLTRLFSLKR